MERVKKKRKWERAGIFLIVGIIGAVVVFAQRAKALEERDRMTLDEIKDIRVALQEYYDDHQQFPADLPVGISATDDYAYQCTQQSGGACARGICTGDGFCTDYELRFTLPYGSGNYGKGEYRANREQIININ